MPTLPSRSRLHSTLDAPATPAPATSWWRRPRWRYAGAAFLLGVAESFGAMAFGFRAEVGGLDVTWASGLLLEISFAFFGFLIGLVVEARQREREVAVRDQARMQALARAQVQLAQGEKLASLGQLASTMAHEVRNPLAILRSSLQNLREAPASGVDGDDQAIEDMIEEVDRLAHVTATITDFARPLVPVRSGVPVTDVMDRTQWLAERLVEGRVAGLRFEAPTDRAACPWVDVDADLLCQALLGLIDNAAEASPPDAWISLDWVGRGDTVVLSVRDQGPGVASDDSARIFEPFFTSRAGGHGLGLAIARQIVEAHGGRLSLATPPDDADPPGACFQITLPRADAAATREAAGVKAARGHE